jgi:anaerobic magnesium-protoporphyrin IX monomethyl ester cyclase
MKILLLSLPDPPGIHVFRFHSAGFGSAFTLPHPDHRYDVYPPIYEAYAAAILENLGHKVSILDCQSPNLGLDQILAEIKRVNPQVIVSRICLPSYEHDLKMMSDIKERFPDVFLVGWGGTCKVFPEDVLKKSRLDLLIREVELECALPDVVESIENNKTETVEGISFRDGEKIVHNKNRPFNKDLDVMPLPAYHLLDMKKYVAPEFHYVLGGSKDKFIPFFSVSGSRGCSFNCLYCPYPVTYGPWRGRSAERIADEIEVLVTKYNIHAIWFHDQTFSMIPQRTVKLCDEIIQRKLDICWATETRVDRLNQPLLKKMKESGCGRLEVGVETGDPQLLAKVGKRGLTVEKIEQIVEFIRKEGIIVETNFLVGLPGHSWESIRKTSELINRIRPDILTTMIVTPYPGTPLYEMVEKNGWLVTKDWSKYTLFEPVFSMPGFTDKDMKDAHTFLYRQYAIANEKREIAEAFRRKDFKTLTKKFALNVPKLFAQMPKIIRDRIK